MGKKPALMFVVFLLIWACSIFFTQDAGKTQTLKGYVYTKESLLYKNTLIYSYDPDPNWMPVVIKDMSEAPKVMGKSAILVDIDSGEILFEKNGSQKLPIASLTKIMTAVIALEHKDIKNEITISKTASQIGENSMQIGEGEIYTLEELLYGLILNSGNDAAYAISESVAGDTPTFVYWMNVKAKELGLKNTRFTDPSGLDDGNESSAEDLARLTRYALQNPLFEKMASTIEIELISEKHKYIYLQNQTNLLTTYPGVAGVKTGYTEKAGLCLVTYAENEGKRLAGVVLNSVDRKGDMILLLDWGYSLLGIYIHHNLL